MDSKTIEKIKENYKKMEKNYVNQLFFQTTHGSTIGRYREKIWEEMFESIVPKKFVIEQSVFIIDSKGNVSNAEMFNGKIGEEAKKEGES